MEAPPGLGCPLSPVFAAGLGTSFLFLLQLSCLYGGVGGFVFKLLMCGGAALFSLLQVYVYEVGP